MCWDSLLSHHWEILQRQDKISPSICIIYRLLAIDTHPGRKEASHLLAIRQLISTQNWFSAQFCEDDIFLQSLNINWFLLATLLWRTSWVDGALVVEDFMGGWCPCCGGIHGQAMEDFMGQMMPLLWRTWRIVALPWRPSSRLYGRKVARSSTSTLSAASVSQCPSAPQLHGNISFVFRRKLSE